MLRRCDFERIGAIIPPRADPKTCIEKIALAFQFPHDAVANLVSHESIPVIVDGWNESKSVIAIRIFIRRCGK